MIYLVCCCRWSIQLAVCKLAIIRYFDCCMTAMFVCALDPRTKDWFLLSGSPVPVWCLTIAYLSFVFLGPKFMRTRRPFSLQTPMVIYNTGCVCLSLYMFTEVTVQLLSSVI